MKKSYLFVVSFLICSCSSQKSDWDSGAQKQEAQDNMQEISVEENTNNQFPSTKPQTNEAQPF